MNSNRNQRSNHSPSNQHRNINIFKHIKEIIEILSLIATVLSALVCVLTLNEMRIERNKAYEPNIMLSPVLISVDTEETVINDMDVSEGGFNSAYSHVESQMNIIHTSLSSFTQDFTNYVFEIPVKNIGDGTCQELTCTYLYKSFELLSEFCKSYNIDFRHSLLSENEFESLHTITAPFILSQGQQEYSFDLPVVYMEVLSNLQFDFSKFYNIVDALPYMLLEIEYKDIQGRKYKQLIKLNVEFHSCRPDKNEKVGDDTIVLNYLIIPELISKEVVK